MSPERWFCCWCPEQQVIYLERERKVFLQNQAAYLLNKPALHAPLAGFNSQLEAERYVELALHRRVVRIAKPPGEPSNSGGPNGNS